MTEYDVLIVGAGPGGSVAAKVAAESGLKTVFFERGRKSGEKNSSGCGLGPRMWREFPELMKTLTTEVAPNLRKAACVINHYLNKDLEEIALEMYYPTESVTYEPAKQFITMNCYRSEFDPWVAGQAVAAGAEQRTSVLIKDLVKDDKGKVIGVQTSKGEKIYGKVIIGADGVISTVAMRSGLNPRWRPEQITLVPQYDFAAPPEKIDKMYGPDGLLADAADGIWWGVNFPSAYQVIFGDGFHIGLGSWMGQWTANPLSYLNTLVSCKPFQRMIKAIDAKPREVQAHLLPWTVKPIKTYTDNVMLIGDAGGFPCPLEAEGVFPAMETGKLAAETAIKCLADGNTSKEALKLYEEKWKKSSVGVEFEAGESLQTLWKNLFFSTQSEENNMEWFIPLWHEIRGGHYDWSEPHIVRFRQIVRKVQEYLPQAMKFVTKYAVPVLSDIMQEDLSMFPQMIKFLETMRPKKKTK
ncbi:MAG TPA: NAD(P)/FAD-dependent oxidoreductase [Candidatus Deferrimicrobium sp.]|nr:NAD(P)/FAD-dependent oxidoreductase [Candidatus Deferrimicrobium sp.]